MNREYKKLLKSNAFEKIDCGQYHYPRKKILGLPMHLMSDKCEVWQLPLRMYKQGLFIIGDSWNCDEKLEFSYAYARTLVDKEVRVIYVTSTLSKAGFVNPFHCKRFIETIGLNDFTDSELHHSNLVDDFDPEVFKKGTKLSIVNSEIGNKHESSEIEAYTSTLTTYLLKIAESNIAKCRRGTCDPDTVVFIEENLYHKSNGEVELQKAIALLKCQGVGIVICCDDSRRFQNISKSFGNYIFFQMDDPIEEIEFHNFFTRSRKTEGLSKESRKALRIAPIDFRQLRGGESHYFKRDNDGRDVVHCFGTIERDFNRAGK